MKKWIAVFLCVLTLMIPVLAFAETDASPATPLHAASVKPEEKPLEKAEQQEETGEEARDTLDVTMLLNRYNPLSVGFEPVGLVRMKAYNKSKNLTLKKSTIQIYEEAAVALNNMMAAAKTEGLRGFYLDNAYRSSALQLSMFRRKQRRYSDYGVDPAVPIKTAIPRTSEHEVGLAIDISCNKHRAMNAAFANTEHGTWLRENSYRFGYILRYPEGKEQITGIVNEPWHYRYVGVELAALLHGNGWVLEEYYSNLAAGKIEPPAA